MTLPRLFTAAVLAGAVVLGASLPASADGGHAHAHKGSSAGAPGDPKKPARVVAITMKEGNGMMSYEPATLEVKRGEQVRFVLKNAGESIDARIATGDDTPGAIEIRVEPSADRVILRVIDNGVGLPPEHKHRLTEPYVTTRVKGTGLGLAIVRKIFEDHGGELTISDRADDHTGAEVFMALPLKQKIVRETGVEKTEVGNEQERIFNRA